MMTLEDVRGDHEEAKTSFDVEAFHVNGQNLEKFPTNLADFLPSLKIISCVKSKLTQILPEDLRPYPSLMYLALARNNIVEIDGNLFKHTPNVQGIILAQNQLQRIGENILSGLSSLRWIDVQLNPCINGYVHTTAGIALLNYEMPKKCPPVEHEKNGNQTAPLRCSLKREINELQLKVLEIRQDFETTKFELQDLNEIFSELIVAMAEKTERVEKLQADLMA